jgi:hypothetical protein
VRRVHLWSLAVVGVVATAATVRADVAIDERAGCVDRDEARRRIDAVLRARGATAAAVAVEVVSSEAGSHVALRVANGAGRVLLERGFELAAGDCAEAPALLAVVIDRLFTGLAAEEWKAAAEPPPVAVRAPVPRVVDAPSPPVPFELSLQTAVSAATQPTLGELELGLRFDRGGAWRAGVAVLARQSMPSDLGSAEVEARTLLGGLGVSRAGDRWRAGVELRGGALRLAGDGFDQDRRAWVGWAEGAASIAWVGRVASVGLVAAASPLARRAVTADRMEAVEIPRFRIGVGLSFPLWREDP